MTHGTPFTGKNKSEKWMSFFIPMVAEIWPCTPEGSWRFIEQSLIRLADEFEAREIENG